jgi:hypothetical protein
MAGTTVPCKQAISFRVLQVFCVRVRSYNAHDQRLACDWATSPALTNEQTRTQVKFWLTFNLIQFLCLRSKLDRRNLKFVVNAHVCPIVVLAFLHSMQIRNILDKKEWEQAYQYEIPVLTWSKKGTYDEVSRWDPPLQCYMQALSSLSPDFWAYLSCSLPVETPKSCKTWPIKDMLW